MTCRCLKREKDFLRGRKLLLFRPELKKEIIYLGVIWWGKYDQGYFAIILTVKISFLLLHHVNNAKLSICSWQVACFRNVLDNI